MRIRSVVNSVRQDFSPKRFLLGLNQDLDTVLRRIDAKLFDHVSYGHSHSMEIRELSNVQLAILYLEDRGFFHHRGFELRAPFRIVKRLALGKGLGAVSTLDQQLVRIATRRYERSVRRKIRETALAFFLNAQRSKSAIFYAYLHDSYFGYRLEGCEITARFLFDKPAAYLSEDEAAFVASLLARPLPKAVYKTVVLEKDIRIMTPKRIIEIGELHRLSWASHVQNRYQYVLGSFRSIPKSLRTR